MAVTVRNAARDRQSAWKKRNPWIRNLEYARRRCNDDDPEGENYKDYYQKAIRCSLTGNQIKEVWDRDNAGDLKRPSLDRIDSRFDYANWNIRFIEHALNCRMAWDKNAAAMLENIVPEFT